MIRQLGLRRLAIGIVPLAALLVLLAVTGLAAAQTPTPVPEEAGPHDFLPELQGIPRDQLFDHFRSSQFTITDAQNNSVTYVMTPGTVTSVGQNTITVTANGATTGTTFGITDTTRVKGSPAPGSLEVLAAGDRVMVLTRQNDTDAVFIMEHRSGGMYHFGGRM